MPVATSPPVQSVGNAARAVAVAALPVARTILPVPLNAFSDRLPAPSLTTEPAASALGTVQEYAVGTAAGARSRNVLTACAGGAVPSLKSTVVATPLPTP